MVRAIVVMGVSASGKSTLAQALASRLGYRFIEGDSLHPAANVAKMAAGIPLNDSDREPWLQSVASTLDDAAKSGGGVAACSALKRRYRDLLRGGVKTPIVFVYPALRKDALLARLKARRGHYMPPSLLDSQLATLEPPAGDEGALEIPGDLPTDEQVALVLARLAAD